MRRKKSEEFIRGSGNVYADLGLPNPEEDRAKADLMRIIADEIERQGLTQTQAAERAGAAQSDISNIVRGRGRAYSLERLFAIVQALGGRVSIVARVGGKNRTVHV